MGVPVVAAPVHRVARAAAAFDATRVGTMSDEPAGLTYCAFWVGDDMTGIPAVSARAMIRDDNQTRRETERLEAERQDRREAECFLARMDGRAKAGLAGVFEAAERYAKAEDWRAERQAERDRYERPEPVSRSAYPETDYEAGRQIDRASELHRELVRYQTARDHAGTEARARAKSGRYDIGRSAGPHAAGTRVAVPPSYGEVSRDGGYIVGVS